MIDVGLERHQHHIPYEIAHAETLAWEDLWPEGLLYECLNIILGSSRSDYRYLKLFLLHHHISERKSRVGLLPYLIFWKSH